MSATAVATLVVEVSAPDIAPALLFNLGIVAGAAAGTITIPAGSNRTIAIRAYDAGGVQTHSGSVTASIQPGANPPIDIVLTPLTGDAPIEATLGSFAVIVAPTADSLLVGDTITLTATILDADGNPVTAQVIWGVLSPRVASVVSTGTQTGRVTAIRPGQTTVVATYGGTAGPVAVAVRGWFAAPTGSSDGDGSARPWDLETALEGGNGKVQPGDTIWLRGGTYTGVFMSSLTGTASAPIVVRAFPGERATLDGDGSTNTLKIDGAWTYYWGFEVQNSHPDRTNSRFDAIWVRNAADVKLIHLVVHDGGSGIFTSRDTPNVEIYGCIIYNNGWQQDGLDRGHGHGIYVKNDVGTKTVRDNILFNQFGFGLHEYSNVGSGGLNGIRVEGNVAFNSGLLALPGTSGAANILVGGEEPVNDGVVVGNMTYYPPAIDQDNIRLGSDSLENGGVLVNGNYLVGGDPVLIMAYWTSVTMTGDTLVGADDIVTLTDPTTSGFTWGGNRHYHDPAAEGWRYQSTRYTFSEWQAVTGLGQTDHAAAGEPTGVRVAVRPSVYETGRATVVVYNWSLATSVSVNLFGVLQVGDRYEVRSVQALFGAPIVQATYDGMITVPLAGVTPPTPIGLSSSPAPVTGPAFDAFIVTRVEP